MDASVVRVDIRRHNYRYAGFVTLALSNGREVRVPMVGTVAQWLRPGQSCTVTLEDPEAVTFENYVLHTEVQIWPLFSRVYTHQRRAPLSDEVLYEYKVLAREAQFESDYEAIVELEQYHYASDEEILARWYCETCHVYRDANVRPICPTCGQPMRFHDLKSATRASRFLVLELVTRAAYEPRFVGYVRVDPPIPLMHRRLPDGQVERNIRERVFPKEWFAHPFHPARQEDKDRSWWELQEEALAEARSPVSRLARVVVHPDYRVDGFGQLALRALFDWVRERWVPEMRERKKAVETIAMMARYNPFMEKVGFVYLWDTASGRPVLYYPLDEEARRYIQSFLQEDPVAREHSGRLYRPRFDIGSPLSGPIVLKEVQKAYTSHLDLSRVSGAVREVLEAFGVRQRVIQKYVLRGVSMEIEPGSVVAILGASGSGKTTLLRVLYGALAGVAEAMYRVDGGEVRVPENARVEALLLNEIEPSFGDAPVAEVLYRLTGDASLAIELLGYAGISDAVLYRAPFSELSTGQKERAKLAYMLARRPNVILVDEFTAHLDRRTAVRVARRFATLAREKGLTLVVVTHREEVLAALSPDRVYVVGYGTFFPLGEVPERGFRVKEPYATYIVQGKKRWEIRRHPTRVRGRVGVIGGGQLLGSVEITGVKGPFTLAELAEHQDKHLADPRFLEAYARGEKLYAWELARPRAYVKPLPVKGKKGQQTWVRLEGGSTGEGASGGSEGSRTQ